jgi:transglutaminase-like putative cysteine protease
VGKGAVTAGNMKFEVSHRTAYAYRAPVAQSHHLVHLKPRATATQSVFHHSLLIEPAPVSQTEITDVFGNSTSLLRIEDQHAEFVVHARSTVATTPLSPPVLDQGAAWETVACQPTRAGAPVDIEVRQFVCRSRHAAVSHDIRKFGLASFPAGRPVLAGAMHMARRIFEDFTFDPKATDVSTPVGRVLEIKRGVCQDFAHLAIAALRSIGLPARYVSGYLMTRPPPGQVKLKGADASHAWLSVWSPEAGWIDFDPTNGLIPIGEHITLAYGRDYDDISPLNGVLLGGGDQTMSVAVDVEPVG